MLLFVWGWFPYGFEVYDGIIAGHEVVKVRNHKVFFASELLYLRKLLFGNLAEICLVNDCSPKGHLCDNLIKSDHVRLLVRVVPLHYFVAKDFIVGLGVLNIHICEGVN